ncbi:MAG: hypothetical protein JWO73_696 [Candidatus Taylorbacteria bacterium]|nr:hypothetical protein [Candidatus Taylorbacteria bacterium]
MQNKIWFKAKRYGWGWRPVTWQGWLILLAYLALVVGAFLLTDSESHSDSDTLISFALPFILLTFCLIAICHKTGEKSGEKIPK